MAARKNVRIDEVSNAIKNRQNHRQLHARARSPDISTPKQVLTPTEVARLTPSQCTPTECRIPQRRPGTPDRSRARCMTAWRMTRAQHVTPARNTLRISFSIIFTRNLLSYIVNTPPPDLYNFSSAPITVLASIAPAWHQTLEVGQTPREQTIDQLNTSSRFLPVLKLDQQITILDVFRCPSGLIQ